MNTVAAADDHHKLHEAHFSGRLKGLFNFKKAKEISARNRSLIMAALLGKEKRERENDHFNYNAKKEASEDGCVDRRAVSFDFGCDYVGRDFLGLEANQLLWLGFLDQGFVNSDGDFPLSGEIDWTGDEKYSLNDVMKLCSQDEMVKEFLKQNLF